MTGREESLEREAGADRVLGRGDELSVGLGEAAQFAHRACERVHLVEEIAAGREKIDLVRRHQRAARQRVRFDEGDHAPIGLGRRVQRQVDADDPAGAELQLRCPAREDAQDRRLPGRDADEIDRRLARGRQRRHCGHAGHPARSVR